MDSKEFFHELGTLIYQIDGIYTKYIKLNNIKSSNELWILYALNDGKDHSQKQIAEDWDIPRTTINTIVKDLEKKGYVTMKLLKGERREMSIILTSEGKKYADTKLEYLYKKEAEVFKNIKNPEEIIKNLRFLLSNMEVINK